MIDFSRLHEELTNPLVVKPEMVDRMREIAHEFNDKLYEHNLFLYLQHMPQYCAYCYMAVCADFPRPSRIITLRDMLGQLMLDNDQLLEGCGFFSEECDELLIQDRAHLDTALGTCFNSKGVMHFLAGMVHESSKGPVPLEGQAPILTSEQVRDLMNGKSVPFAAQDGVIDWGGLQIKVEDSNALVVTTDKNGRTLLL